MDTYIDIYRYIHVCRCRSMYRCVYKHTYIFRVSARMSIFVWIYICIHLCMCIHMEIHVSISIYMYMFVCIECRHVSLYLCVFASVCMYTCIRPTQSIMYVPLQVNRFRKIVLLIVQYKYLRSCSGDFILQNLILCTRSCGTGFITQSVGFFIST